MDADLLKASYNPTVGSGSKTWLLGILSPTKGFLNEDSMEGETCEGGGKKESIVGNGKGLEREEIA
jgi:hypothetical protein